MRLDPAWWKAEVVRPVLLAMGAWSREAESLLTGTAMVESKLRHLVQLGGGPALGPYQMEPTTHESLWRDFLRYRPWRAAAVVRLLNRDVDLPDPLSDANAHHVALALEEDLIVHPEAAEIPGLWAYATAMARCRYLWDPRPIPIHPWGLAQYWKRVYNSHLGAGDPFEAFPAFVEAVNV